MDYLSSPIDRCNFGFRLVVLGRRWRQAIDKEIQAVGLTDATWRPLLHLYRLGDGIRQKDLASSIGIEGPTIVRLLDSLVDRGLLERVEVPEDRRAKSLRLTEDGRQLVLGIQKVITTLEDQIVSGLSDLEFAQCGGFIGRIESALDECLRQRK